ncbi:MAG: enoyl-CoA hydratase/isomerase family protein [Alphaproteobacteria bacterium]|nr:enoyl-CoA hydratase/isomerase family protein [Alphaproteobacteria bacterium]
MADTLRVERTGEIVEVTLARPSHRNALDDDLWQALRREGLALHDAYPRVVILSGEGEHFCAGMDLSPSNPLLARIAPLVAAHDTYRLSEVIRHLKASFGVFARLPAVVICAIEGACLGGGLELALAADLRIAGESAVFSMPETQFGMVPDVGGTVRLSKLIGRSRASELILTGERIGAIKAERWGLVNEVVHDGTALERARAVAARILKASPTATRQALLALRHADELGDDERFEIETEAGARALVSGEVTEGLASFAAKREPRW